MLVARWTRNVSGLVAASTRTTTTARTSRTRTTRTIVLSIDPSGAALKSGVVDLKFRLSRQARIGTSNPGTTRTSSLGGRGQRPDDADRVAELAVAVAP